MEVKIKKINILAVLDFWTKKEKLKKNIIGPADLDFWTRWDGSKYLRYNRSCWSWLLDKVRDIAKKKIPFKNIKIQSWYILVSLDDQIFLPRPFQVGPFSHAVKAKPEKGRTSTGFFLFFIKFMFMRVFVCFFFLSSLSSGLSFSDVFHQVHVPFSTVAMVQNRFNNLEHFLFKVKPHHNRCIAPVGNFQRSKNKF